MKVDLALLKFPVAVLHKESYRFAGRNAAFDALFNFEEKHDALVFAEALGMPLADVCGAAGKAKSAEGPYKVYPLNQKEFKYLEVDVSNFDENHYLLQLTDCTSERKSEERFTSIVETSFDGFWDWDLVTGYEYMSPQFWRMFGVDPATKKHDPAEWQDLINPEDAAKALVCLEEHWASKGKRPYYLEARYTHSSGSIVHVVCKGRVIEWDENDKPLRMIGTHTDITELIQARSDADKAEALAEKRLNEFVAHEMRNPLFAAITASDFILERCEKIPEIHDLVAEDLSAVRASLSFLEELINSTLELEKCLAGKVALHPKRIHAKDILTQVKCVLELRNSRVPIYAECDDDIELYADSIRIKQVIMNLASNSVKFTRSGYVRLTGKVVGDRVQLVVEDSGPGISEGMVEKLFTRNVDLNQESQGNGIGLYLCKILVSLMGGNIRMDPNYVSDAPGDNNKGSRFIVDVPGELPEVVEQKETIVMNSIEQALERKLNVIIVDDDRLNRSLLRRRMTKLCDTWEYHQAANGEELLQRSKTERFDLILLDNFMGSAGGTLTGVEVVTELRKRGNTSIVAGISGNDMKTDFIKAGADLFWRKPFPPNETLLEDISRVLLAREGKDSES